MIYLPRPLKQSFHRCPCLYFYHPPIYLSHWGQKTQRSSWYSLLKILHWLHTTLCSKLHSLGELPRWPDSKVALPLLAISHLSSLVYCFFYYIYHHLRYYIFCLCDFCSSLPFKWKLHKGRDFCVLLTAVSPESRTELKCSRYPIHIYWLNKWKAYKLSPNGLACVSGICPQHSLALPHSHSPITYVPNTELLVLSEAHRGCSYIEAILWSG